VFMNTRRYIAAVVWSRIAAYLESYTYDAGSSL
jgi:hypothetical protein